MLACSNCSNWKSQFKQKGNIVLCKQKSPTAAYPGQDSARCSSPGKWWGVAGRWLACFSACLWSLLILGA